MALTVQVGDGGGVVADVDGVAVLTADAPALLQVWDPASGQARTSAVAYATVERSEGSTSARATAEVAGVRLVVDDVWRRVDDETWQLARTVSAQGPATLGLRAGVVLRSAAPGRAFTDFRYFAPPALWDFNDLDGDGLEDYLGTQTVVIREDRLNTRGVLAYEPGSGVAVTLSRADRPEFETGLDRPHEERVFLQATDVGSIGVRPAGTGAGTELVAFYPFAEVDRSHALLVGERPGWESYWPLSAGTVLTMTYQLRATRHARFVDAAWDSFARAVDDLAPEPVELATSLERLVEYKYDATRAFYVEGTRASNPDERYAGIVTNCHPQDGRQLANVIQFGFTGQNGRNALNLLRSGHAGSDDDLRRGRSIAEFYVTSAHLPQTGMFRTSYNVDTDRFDSWWFGLLLPLAFSRGESLEQLMGPLYEQLKPVIDVLQVTDGSYLRCMAEDALWLLRCYELERRHGVDHPDWLAACVRHAEFLLRVQNDDGTWFRAYDMGCRPILEPAMWFGTTPVEQRSSSSAPVEFLCELFSVVDDERYLAAAKRAGRYIRENAVDAVKFNGGLHDSMYAKGQLVDYSGIMFPMRALLALHKATGDEYYTRGAVDAARLFAAWVCLWDVPLPPGSTLERYGFRSTGILACDTAGSGFTHPAGLYGIVELTEIAGLARDPALLRAAELTFLASYQTVATPEKSWGYAFPGLQEEGYLVSWLLIDDPIFKRSSFGNRLKGEGNKTCLGWIAAVGIDAYLTLTERFGTTDYGVLRERWGLGAAS